VSGLGEEAAHASPPVALEAPFDVPHAPPFEDAGEDEAGVALHVQARDRHFWK
jgi:hypothetical protein